MARKPHIPTEAEDREINEASRNDPDNPPLDDDFFAHARRGRPPLPEEARKRRVNLMLDPDVVEKLRARGNMSAEVNAILREELGV